MQRLSVLHTEYGMTSLLQFFLQFYINKHYALLVNLLPGDGRQKFDNFRGNIRVKIATVAGLVCVHMNIV